MRLKKPVRDVTTRYSTTFTLLAVSIVLLVLTNNFPKLLDYLAFNPSLWSGWFVGIFTCLVTHAGWGHLIGNFTAGLPFMLFLEHQLGSRRFANFFVLCGISGSLLNYLLTGPVACIGSSGAVFGCIIGASMLFGCRKPEHVLGCVFALCMLIPQIALGPYATIYGIAFYAHVGGGLAGIMLTSRLYTPKALSK